MYPCEISHADGRTSRAWLDDDGRVLKVESGSLTIDEAQQVVDDCYRDSRVEEGE